MVTKPNPSTIRWNPSDAKIVALLRKKLGVKTSELMRLAIRALAEKEGVTA